MVDCSLDEVCLINCNENSARNFNKVTLGDIITLWFSYETIVAFRTAETGFCVTENIWGNTTGKHLNWVSDKADRLPREVFLDKLNSILLQIRIKEK